MTVARNPDKHLNFHHFVSFSALTIKTPYIVHKNVSVYCVEFQCTKKQTSLLLEVWHKAYYSEFQIFILLASFYSSSTSHNETTTKTKNCIHL